jgi:hypothetical protein
MAIFSCCGLPARFCADSKECKNALPPELSPLAVAMGATASSFALPCDPLTKTTGKPNFAVVMELRKELFESATPVCSAQGRQRGHLSVAVPAAQRSAVPRASGPPVSSSLLLSLLLSLLELQLLLLSSPSLDSQTWSSSSPSGSLGFAVAKSQRSRLWSPPCSAALHRRHRDRLRRRPWGRAGGVTEWRDFRPKL